MTTLLMTSPQNNPNLSQEDITLIREVYARRVRYIAWLVKSIALGALVGLGLGWLTCGMFNSLWLNPFTWLGAAWGGSVLTAIKTSQGSVVKDILLAPLSFKKELSRQSAESRKDKAMLVARFQKD